MCVCVCVLVSGVPSISLFYGWVTYHCEMLGYQPPEWCPIHSYTLDASSMPNSEHAVHTYDDVWD